MRHLQGLTQTSTKTTPGVPLTLDATEGGEGMVVAEIDIALSIEQQQLHDLVGSYNRFDIFPLTVDQRPNRPITLIRDEGDAREATQADGWPPIGETPPGASA